MKLNEKLSGLYLWTLLIFGVAATAFRTAALFVDYSQATTHFEDNTFITIANVLAVLGTLLMLTYPLTAPKKLNLVYESTGTAAYIPAGIVSVAMAFLALRSFTKYYTAYAPTIVEYVCLALAIFGALSVVALLLSVLVENSESEFKSAFNMSIIIFLALYAAYLYFNTKTLPTNSPVKLVDQMAYLSASAFFIYETRATLGRPMWKAYIASGLVTSLLTAYSAIPSFILYIADGRLLSDSLDAVTLALALCLFSTLKTIKAYRFLRDERCETADVIAELHEMRENALMEKRSAQNASPVQEENDEENDAVDMENYKMDIQMPPAEYYGITEDTTIE